MSKHLDITPDYYLILLLIWSAEVVSFHPTTVDPVDVIWIGFKIWGFQRMSSMIECECQACEIATAMFPKYPDGALLANGHLDYSASIFLKLSFFSHRHFENILGSLSSATVASWYQYEMMMSQHHFRSQIAAFRRHKQIVETCSSSSKR